MSADQVSKVSRCVRAISRSARRETKLPSSTSVSRMATAGVSQRATFTGRYSQLFTVPVGGGMETQLPIPNAARATYSPDGRRIAYNPIAGRYQQWKDYRGGTVQRLWLYVDAFGATRLRFLVQAQLLWLAAVFAALLLAGARRAGQRLPRAIVVRHAVVAVSARD